MTADGAKMTNSLSNEPTPMMYIKCQFCNEDDFDDIGLKIHLLRGHCEVFEAIENYVSPYLKQKNETL
jgi:hypothetical protein